MTIHYRTQGIIFEKIDRKEADQLFTIYTKDFGRLEILGKGIRKIKSKLRSGIELFYLSEIEFIQGKNYKTLTDAILIEKFPHLRKDLRKLRIAYKISEGLVKLVREQEEDKKIWQLLNEIFEKLDKEKFENGKLEIIYYYFFWNLLCLLGYQPELYHCAICQKRLKPEKLFFSSKEGGVICNFCKKNIKSIREISPETIKVLRILIEKNWRLLEKLKIEKKFLQFLNIITNDYYLYLSNQLVNSKEI